MDAGGTITSPLVETVRARAKKAMTRVERDASFTLAEIALASPQESATGYRYLLERATDRVPIGCVEGDFAHQEDPIVEYCLTSLPRGATFEFERMRAEPERAEIRHDGQVIGASRCVAHEKFFGITYPSRWQLTYGGELLGEVERGSAVTRDNLFIRRPNGPDLPLILARARHLNPVLGTLWHFVSLRPLSKAPRRNNDLVIPANARRLLSADQVPFYFAAALLFRTMYFKLDFSGQA